MPLSLQCSTRLVLQGHQDGSSAKPTLSAGTTVDGVIWKVPTMFLLKSITVTELDQSVRTENLLLTETSQWHC